jgi:hypothetical protein
VTFKGGVIMAARESKRQHKSNQDKKSGLHGDRADFGPARFLYRFVPEFAGQLIFRQKKSLTLWNNSIRKA